MDWMGEEEEEEEEEAETFHASTSSYRIYHFLLNWEVTSPEMNLTW